VTNDSTKNQGKLAKEAKGATLELGKAGDTTKTQTITPENVNNIITDDESSEGEMEYKEEHRFPNGAIYKGGWKNGKRHGEGTQIWPDGARYEGSWRK